MATADDFGEVILSLLPHIGTVPVQVKRTLDRRFVSAPPTEKHFERSFATGALNSRSH